MVQYPHTTSDSHSDRTTTDDQRERTLTRRRTLAATGGLLSAGIGLSLTSGAASAQEGSGTDTGETIVVAPDGSDSNDGTVDDPLATMQEAIRERAEPGDTVAFREGEYTEQFLIYFAAGEPDAPITVEAYEDEDVAFVGNHRHRIRAPHIRVRGIEFRDGQGVVVAKSRSEDVHFYDCESHNHTDDGFSASEDAHNIEFHGCSAHHNYDTPISPEAGDRNADGFDVTLRAYNIRYYDCDAWHNVDDGFDTNQGGFGIELHDCRAWQNGLNPRDEPVGNGVGIKMQNGRESNSDDPGDPTLNVRCLSWDNASDGQRFYRTGGTCYAVNLTSFDNGDDNYQSRDYGGGANQYYYLNCISAGSGNVELDADEQVERRNTWTLGINDPQLAQLDDPGASDFARLTAGSPCIDTGTTDTAPVTIDVSDGEPDLGAYEFDDEERDSDEESADEADGSDDPEGGDGGDGGDESGDGSEENGRDPPEDEPDDDRSRGPGSEEYEITFGSIDGGANYEFSVTGEILWGSDDITDDRQSATGRVWGCCTDQYRYTGSIESLEIDGEIDVSVESK